MKEAEGEKLIDWQAGLDATGGNEQLLAELIEIFFEEYPKLLTGIRDAIDRGAAKDLQRFAHTLKGSLRYFGDTAAGRLAYELEGMGSSGAFDTAPALLEQLTPAVERLLPELREYVDAHQ